MHPNRKNYTNSGSSSSYPRQQPTLLRVSSATELTGTPAMSSPMDEDDDWGTELDDEACLEALTQIESNQTEEVLSSIQTSREDSNRNIKFLNDNKKSEMRNAAILNQIQLETKVKKDDAMINISQKFSQHFDNNDSIIEDEHHREMGNIINKYRNSMGTHMSQFQPSQGRKRRKDGDLDSQFSQLQESRNQFSKSRQNQSPSTSTTSGIQKLQRLSLIEQNSPIRGSETNDNTNNSFVGSSKDLKLPDSFHRLSSNIDFGENPRYHELKFVAKMFNESEEEILRLLSCVPKWIHSFFKEPSCSYPDELRDLFSTIIHEATELEKSDRRKERKSIIRHPLEFPQGALPHLLQNDMSFYVESETAYETLICIMKRVQDLLGEFKAQDKIFGIFENYTFQNFVKLLFWAEVVWHSILAQEPKVYLKVGAELYVKTLLGFTDFVFQVEWRFWLHADIEVFIRKWTLRILPKIISLGYFNHTIDHYDKLDKILHNTLDNDVNVTLENLSNICDIIAFLAPNKYVYKFLCYQNDARDKTSNPTCLILKLVNAIGKIVARDFPSTRTYKRDQYNQLSSLFIVYLRLISILETKKFVYGSEVAKKWNNSFLINFPLPKKKPRDMTTSEQRISSHLSKYLSMKSPKDMAKALGADEKPLNKNDKNLDPKENAKYSNENKKGKSSFKYTGPKNWMSSSEWEETSSEKRGLCQCRKHVSGLVIILYYKILKLYVSRILKSKFRKVKSFLRLESIKKDESEFRKAKTEIEIQKDIYAGEYIKESTTWASTRRERDSENSCDLTEQDEDSEEDDDEYGGYDTPSNEDSDDETDTDDEFKTKRKERVTKDVSKLKPYFNYFHRNMKGITPNIENGYKMAINASILLTDDFDSHANDSETGSEGLFQQFKKFSAKKNICPEVANNRSLTINCLNEGILFMNHQILEAENIATLWGSTGATAFIKIYQIYLQHFNKIPLLESTKTFYERIVKILDSNNESESSFTSFIFSPIREVDVEMCQTLGNCEFIPPTINKFQCPTEYSEAAIFSTISEIREQISHEYEYGPNNNGRTLVKRKSLQESSGSSDEDVVNHRRYDDTKPESGKMFRRIKLKKNFEFEITIERPNENKRMMLDSEVIASQIRSIMAEKNRLEIPQSPMSTVFIKGAQLARRVEIALKENPEDGKIGKILTTDNDEFFSPLDGEILEEEKREKVFDTSKFSYIDEEFEEYGEVPPMPIIREDSEGSESDGIESIKIDLGEFPIPTFILKEAKNKTIELKDCKINEKRAQAYVEAPQSENFIYKENLKRIELERDRFPPIAANKKL